MSKQISYDPDQPPKVTPEFIEFADAQTHFFQLIVCPTESGESSSYNVNSLVASRFVPRIGEQVWIGEKAFVVREVRHNVTTVLGFQKNTTAVYAEELIRIKNQGEESEQ